MPTLTLTVCDSCRAPTADLPMPDRLGAGDTLCPRCAGRVALENAAADHLHALLLPTVQAWAQHWAAVGVSPVALGSVLGLEGYHWHPDGALYRGQDSRADDSAAAVIREALAEG